MAEPFSIVAGAIDTVKGELRIARFLVNFFNIVGRVGLWLVRLVPGRYLTKAELADVPFFLSSSFPTRQSQPVLSSATMAPQLDTAQHIFI
jgi:hypothetical protein